MTNHIDNLWFELRGTNKRKNALAEGFEFLEYFFHSIKICTISTWVARKNIIKYEKDLSAKVSLKVIKANSNWGWIISRGYIYIYIYIYIFVDIYIYL